MERNPSSCGRESLFITKQTGRIRSLADGRLIDPPVLDIRDRVSTAITERGLFSVASHLDFRANGYFYIDYMRKPDGATVVERYRLSTNDTRPYRHSRWLSMGGQSRSRYGDMSLAGLRGS